MEIGSVFLPGWNRSNFPWPTIRGEEPQRVVEGHLRLIYEWPTIRPKRLLGTWRLWGVIGARDDTALNV